MIKKTWAPQRISKLNKKSLKGKLEQSRGEPQQAKAQELKKRNNQNRVDLN
jgi:hypothetical protein